MVANSFVCPNCKQPLVTTAEEFRCKPCTLTFPLVDGIPDFFISETQDEAIDIPNRTWLDPNIVAARDTKYRLCARTLKGMRFCIREIVSRTGVSSRVLEVGMGTGHFTCWLAEDSRTGTKLYAFDYSWPIIETAKANTRGFSNVRLFRANARGTLPFTDGSFDVLLLRLTPFGAQGTPNVQAAYQILKPGGWYFEAGWEPTIHTTSKTEWVIQHGFESAESHQWQYWRTETMEEQDATRVELEHLAAQGSQSAVKALKRETVTRPARDLGSAVQVMTIEYLMIAQKPYTN